MFRWNKLRNYLNLNTPLKFKEAINE